MTHPATPDGESTTRIEQEPSTPCAAHGAPLTKRSAVRFVVTFGVLLGLFYLVYLPVSQTAAYRGYLGLIARASGAGIWMVGQDARVTGRLILSENFSFQIVPGCDGMEAFALFGAAVLASPVAWKARLAFLFIGTAVLFVVNTIRIVTLFLVGVYLPKALSTMHWDLWPGFIIVAVLVCWLTWARWTLRRQGSQEPDFSG